MNSEVIVLVEIEFLLLLFENRNGRELSILGFGELIYIINNKVIICI